MSATQGFGISMRQFAGPSFYEGRMTPLRVAHLTDLHVGRVTPMKVQRHSALITNAAKPDLVVITGDFVCHSQLYLQALTEHIASFEAPVFAVLGNHDHWSGAPEVRRALIKGGACVLDNQHTVQTFRGQKLQIVGLDDAYTGNADRDAATRGLDPELPTLGLSHIAEEADGLWARGVPLVLSGHTHAGQITLAKLNELALGRIGGHRYVHGLYGTRKDPAAGAVYVGAGIGASVMPFRLGDRGRREVTLFELGEPAHGIVEHHEEQPALPGRKPSQRTIERRKQKVLEKLAKRLRSSSTPS